MLLCCLCASWQGAYEQQWVHAWGQLAVAVLSKMLMLRAFWTGSPACTLFCHSPSGLTSVLLLLLCCCSACSLKLRWLPGQLKRFRNLHTLQISGAKVNMASLFKGMASIKGLRRAVIHSVGIDKKTQEQGLPDDLFAPLARHTGEDKPLVTGNSNREHWH
jgi:hypothetical protein